MLRSCAFGFACIHWALVRTPHAKTQKQNCNSFTDTATMQQNATNNKSKNKITEENEEKKKKTYTHVNEWF